MLHLELVGTEIAGYNVMNQVLPVLDEKPCVLVVDDSEEILIPLDFLLKTKGIDCRLARTGKEALALLSTHSFSLIFLDFNLPDMTGSQFLEKRGSKDMHIPVVVSSAADKEDLQRQIHVPVRFLSKPFRFSEVLQTLLEILQ